MFYILLVVGAITYAVVHFGWIWFAIMAVTILVGLFGLLFWDATRQAKAEAKRIPNIWIPPQRRPRSMSRRKSGQSYPSETLSFIEQRNRELGHGSTNRVYGNTSPRPAPTMTPASTDRMITKGLLIASPHIERILDGEKTWEMRTRHFRHRGPIALIQSGSGHIVGVASIVESRGPLDLQELIENEHRHRIPAARLNDAFSKYRFAWILDNVRKLPRPIPYHHRAGAQSIVNLDSDASEAVSRA